MSNQYSDDPTDGLLIDQFVRHGSEQAFRQLYRRHAPRLLRLLVRISGGASSDAEDVLQESWIRAARRMSTLKQRDSFYPWIRAIALHVHTDSQRRDIRRKRMMQIDSRDVHDVGVEQDLLPQETAAEAPDERVLDLERCIRALPGGYRTVLVLHDVEGFTHAEIAELLGIAEGTSKSQLHDARREVRRMMNNEKKEEGRDVSYGQ